MTKNKNIEHITDLIHKLGNLNDQEVEMLTANLKDIDKHIELVEFKLERAEKVKRTTGILLEETIEELDQKRMAIEEANIALQKSLSDLKETQRQLIQSEKMASLGELTAGIAHEIQNPLNFVNNFSEVSVELIEEMLAEMVKKDYEEASEIAADIKTNLEKILHHGKRADGIVRGMLQHSRKNTGQKEEVDINNLCDEYLRLAYHGLRAKDKSFNASIETSFDPNVGQVNVVSQDLGRVVLNLVNNAFYAVTEKKHGSEDHQYNPTVSLITKKEGNTLLIIVKDNANGVPPHVADKIFQPFFTTKPTGQGTGLGLSLSYDIIKSHGGHLKLETKLGEGTSFIISIPITQSQ